MVWNMSFLFNGMMFRFHVNFRECNQNSLFNWGWPYLLTEGLSSNDRWKIKLWNTGILGPWAPIWKEYDFKWTNLPNNFQDVKVVKMQHEFVQKNMAMSLKMNKNDIYIYTWNPNDPCFDWKGPYFGGLIFKNRGQLGSMYINTPTWSLQNWIFPKRLHERLVKDQT